MKIIETLVTLLFITEHNYNVGGSYRTEIGKGDRTNWPIASQVNIRLDHQVNNLKNKMRGSYFANENSLSTWSKILHKHSIIF